MENKSLSFIGGGRITRILLTAFKSKGINFKEITVTDTNLEVLSKLKLQFPSIRIEGTITRNLLKADYIFLAVHPPVIAETLEKIKMEIGQGSVLISLAPKFTIEKISLLGGFQKIVRLLPLASSIIGEGYNPVVFSRDIDSETKKNLLNLFLAFGETIEVAESKIEVYAMIVAMGPTYFWFQYYKLIELAKSFGMDEKEAEIAVEKMLKATMETMFNSGLNKDSIIDLIPVKPIGENESDILKIYDEKLTGLYQKIKP